MTHFPSNIRSTTTYQPVTIEDLLSIFNWIRSSVGIPPKGYKSTADNIARKKAKDKVYRDHCKMVVMGPCLLTQPYNLPDNLPPA